MNKTRSILPNRWSWLTNAIAIAFTVNLINVPVKSEDSINPDADQILRSMSTYLAETEAFTVNADIDFEIVTQNGQKLQLSSFATLMLQRPNQFYIRRQGVSADAEFILDGETLTIHSKRKNVYAQLDSSGTIDDAIRLFESETGVPAPGADLLFADVYNILSSGVESSAYLGTTYINGIECHHLAFREEEVDWQIWIQVSDTPLPMKYVITSKWVTGAPQYEIRFRDWDTNPQIDEQVFIFSPPEGATRLETIPVNELNEFTEEE